MTDSASRPTSCVWLASLEEAAAVASVLREAFAAYASLYTPAALAHTTPTAREIQDRWHEGPVWIVHADGKAAGTLSAVPGDRQLYLRSMGVRPAARGRGLG